MYPTYEEILPWASRYVIEHHICTIGVVCIQIDCVTMIGWSKLYMTTIVLINCLRQYPCSWDISDSRYAHSAICWNVCRASMDMSKQWDLSPLEGYVVIVIDDRWLHFVDHLINSMPLASHPSSCPIRYIYWFRLMSHPYILLGTNEDWSYLYSNIVIHIVRIMTKHNQPHDRSILVWWVTFPILYTLLFLFNIQSA